MDRIHYHHLLDQAMDATKQGEYFLPQFVDLILRERDQPPLSHRANASAPPVSSPGQARRVEVGKSFRRFSAT
jgi:hypothetical protein